MFNYLELLERVLLIPQKAYNTGNEELWSKFEKEVGIVFPNDYKKLIGRYGTGGIGNFIWFLTPFSADRNVNYLERMNIMLEAYKISKSKLPEYFIHNVYPDKGGLLPWGYTDNGDELYWKTNECLDNWEIIIYESASPVAACQVHIHHFSSLFLGLHCFPCSKSWSITRFSLSSTLWVLVSEKCTSTK